MIESNIDGSVKLFFESFSKHLRRIRDDGKDPGQAYRAQILLGQLQQFEKAIDEWRQESAGRHASDGPGNWMHLSDLDGLVSWLTTDQQLIKVTALFYLNNSATWQCLAGEREFPKRLKVGVWLERGSMGQLEAEPIYVIYVFGQPRFLICLDNETEGQGLALIRFVARLLPLFIDGDIREPANLGSVGAGMIAQDEHFLEMLTLVKRVAAKDVTILLEGESGTGKEVIANFIHRFSSRRDKPFVAVNCAAIPAGLIESELFGHEKGAFTGAHQRKIGRLEEAQGGTLFLDEIGEIELAMQAKLLRFIQLREFHRVGGRQKLSVNVRIVAATNRDLKARASEGQFREDLYYRLSVAPFRVPPLRHRVGDIVPLVHFFFNKYAKEFSMNLPPIDGSVLQRLAGYPFPGNVRELENLVQNILVLSQGEHITVAHLPEYLHRAEPTGEVVLNDRGQARRWRPVKSIGRRVALRRGRPGERSVHGSATAENNMPWQIALPRTNDELKDVRQQIQEYARLETQELERRFLEELLHRAGGSMPEASRLSGINRTLLYKMLERTRE